LLKYFIRKCQNPGGLGPHFQHPWLQRPNQLLKVTFTKIKSLETNKSCGKNSFKK